MGWKCTPFILLIKFEAPWALSPACSPSFHKVCHCHPLTPQKLTSNIKENHPDFKFRLKPCVSRCSEEDLFTDSLIQPRHYTTDGPACRITLTSPSSRPRTASVAFWRFVLRVVLKLRRSRLPQSFSDMTYRPQTKVHTVIAMKK